MNKSFLCRGICDLHKDWNERDWSEIRQNNKAAFAIGTILIRHKSFGIMLLIQDLFMAFNKAYRPGHVIFHTVTSCSKTVISSSNRKSNVPASVRSKFEFFLDWLWPFKKHQKGPVLPSVHSSRIERGLCFVLAFLTATFHCFGNSLKA